MTAMNTALHDPIFVGNSEMADRMRAFDWAASDVGSPAQWPENLRVAVHLCLSSRFPICLWWGRDLAMLYNDAFLPWLGEAKHPRALMQPGREVWPEIWDMIGPMLDSVIATGEATYSEDTQLFYDRKLPKEEVYITWSFSAIFSADGRTVDGVFCPYSENTEKVVGARRLETLRRLGIRPAEERTVDAACKEAAAVLAQNSCDVPFAAIYVVEPATREARLAATALTEHDRLLPDIVSASEGDKHSPWPLAAVLRTKRSVGCARLVEHGVRIRAAPWAEYVDTALVVPIQAAEDQLWGLLVAGVSTRRPLDAEYRTFFDLVAGHVGTAISDARAHEAQRQRAEALAEIDHAKTAFFSNVSHEFRTPLTLLLGPLEDMLARADGSVTVERGELDLVHRNSLRLLKLVNTLLDFSRIEVGRVQASYEPLDLPAVTADLASLFRAAIEKAGMRLSIDCPPLGEPVYVDRSMWEKIVLNLLSNAFKFTFEGEIEVSLHRAGACAELSVRDTGTGIAEHDVPRIFERFHRIEGARGRTYEGSRIGLELVQELAKLHDGTVRAESTLGRGSRFMVSVPLGHAHLPAAHIGAKQASTALGANAFAEEALRWLPDELGNASPVTADPTAEIGPSERILFADDNADLRQYVHHLLSPTHRLQLVADGEAALAAALENPPELVLTDVMMPRLDGFGLIKALRADPRTRDVRVIMLSARAGEEARVEGLAAGANDYLVKPFSARELLARVNSNLETSRATREALAREQRLRKTAEDAETHSKEELAAELAAMTSLHQLNGRLLAKTKLQPLLEEVLDASMALMAADFGNVQLYDEHTRKLKIVAQRGFKQEFLDYFNSVPEGTGTCGTALLSKERVVVEDVLTAPVFQPHLKIVGGAGYRAVQSTPLFGRRGRVLGMISTHFRQPHRPSERQLRFMDLYATVAVQLIEQKRTEEALRRSEERFRRYFDLGLIGMAITSPTQGVLEVNDEMCRILGYEKDELLQKTWAEMTYPDDVRADVAQFNRVLSGEIDGYSLDKRWIRKDGRMIHSIMAAKCVRRTDGSVDYLVGLVQDITERKQAGEALADARFELARMMRVTTMGELAASIAHEVNQPLAAVVTNSDACVRWLALDPPDMHEATSALHRIVRDSNRAANVIKRIRAFLKRQPTQRVEVDVDEVIADVIGFVSPEFRKGVSVVVHQADRPARVHADRVQLEQVILNLVVNALDAMRPVTDRARILSITAAHEGLDMARISVRDTGVGLDWAQRQCIFNAFFTTKPEGMGMGLAISRSIIEDHGGQLWVTSNKGPGETFHVTLPRSSSAVL